MFTPPGVPGVPVGIQKGTQEESKGLEVLI